ncbi:MAG: GAF domain-containing protein [Deltaproteobacteria bacterium]|nr:GAF domain-containing protein [Deltaproteobacteria bacterium]MDQ3297788.1 GAF domain-containing protein [Myxococcota bacterium]
MVAADNAVADPQMILRLLAYGVLVVGPDWRVLYANPEAERMFGSKGTTLWERCPALEQTAFAAGFRYAMADRTELLSESSLPAIGWCQARARPTPDGGLLISMRQVNAHTIETGQAKTALVMAEIGDALTREESLRSALVRCAQAMVRQLDAALVRIWTVDHDAGELTLCGSAGIETGDPQQNVLKLGEHKVGIIAEDGDPYLTNDAATDLHIGRTAWIRSERIVAFAGYPLRIQDRIVGVMALYSRNKIDHDMLNSLSSIADAIALGIDRKTADVARRHAEDRLRKQAGYLEVLHILGQQLAAVLDVEVLVQKVIDAATRLAGAQLGVFFYNLPNEFMLYAISGAPREAFDKLAVPRSTTLLAPTFIEQKVVRIDDLRASEQYGRTGPHFGLPPEHPPITSYLAVPVTGRDRKRIGALMFGHERVGAFTAETQRLIEGIASTAAIAMDNARLFREAHELIAALEKSNRELDQFAYVASHDLKAPLRGIANLAQWIEDDLEGQLNDQTREHLHLLRGRVSRLEYLIAGILAYSRAGRDRGEVERIDVGRLVKETWELLAPPPTAKLVVEPNLPVLMTSRTQLQQIVMNLMSNAVKYNPGRELVIDVGMNKRGRQYEFFVADNGVGIAPEYHEKIWGLFQTLERRDKVESTGIGLSIVRKIVESLGGTTRVESRPDAGATFFFTWPAELDGESST